MAQAHPGYPTITDTRLRLLVGVFDVTAADRSATIAELRECTSLRRDTLVDLLFVLQNGGLVSAGEEPTCLTKDGMHVLRHAGLIELDGAGHYALSCRGLQVLEQAPPRRPQEVRRAHRLRVGKQLFDQQLRDRGVIAFHSVAHALGWTYRQLQTRIDAGEVRVQRIGERWEWPVNVADALRLLQQRTEHA